MENKLEQLLNTLIQKGWKPFPNEWIDCYDFKFSNRGHTLMCCSSDDDDEYTHTMDYSRRDIASKESGLWQFVCKNGMIPKENHERVYDVSWGEYGVDCKAQIISREPEYRLIESALCDEDKLEEFLLSNIKVDE